MTTADDTFTNQLARPIGKADWLYDDEYDMHIPCCSQPNWFEKLGRVWRCSNGPLTGDQIMSGDCGEDHHMDKAPRDARWGT